MSEAYPPLARSTVVRCGIAGFTVGVLAPISASFQGECGERCKENQQAMAAAPTQVSREAVIAIGGVLGTLGAIGKAKMVQMRRIDQEDRSSGQS